jgi:hypothetical protein
LARPFLRHVACEKFHKPFALMLPGLVKPFTRTVILAFRLQQGRAREKECRSSRGVVPGDELLRADRGEPELLHLLGHQPEPLPRQEGPVLLVPGRHDGS